MRSTIFTLSIAAVVAFLTTTGDAQDAKPEPIKVGPYSFSYGKPWVRQQVTSSMRAAQLTYKQEDKKLANVDVAFFLMGGSMQANLDRWAGQFTNDSKTKSEKKEVNGKEITYFEGKGTFQDSMGGPFSGKTVNKENYAVLAAILPAAQGRLVFLKMKGPADAVEAAKKSFMAVAESALAAE